MNLKEMLKFADDIVFAKTGQHLDDLQAAVLRGTLQRETYKEIAKDFDCSESRIREIGSELWQLLSEELGENINKKNFRAAIERLQNASVVNFGQDVVVSGTFNICGEGRHPPNTPNSPPQNQETPNTKQPQTPHQDLSEMPDLGAFYDRTPELETLTTWILQEQCRLIAITGISGIGKTSLAVQLVQQIKNQFDYIIWRTIDASHTLDEFQQELIQLFSQSEKLDSPTTKPKPLSLIKYLQKHRCLIILDDVHNLFSSGELAGKYKPEYEEYRHFFKQIEKLSHQSCFLLIGWEQPREISQIESQNNPIHTLQINGLDIAAAGEILRDYGLAEIDYSILIHRYQGNPLWLKSVATLIQELGVNVTDLLQNDTILLPEDVKDILRQQCDRLSDREKQILSILAKETQPLKLSKLIDKQPNLNLELVNVLQSLQRRCLVDKIEDSFWLSPLIKQYLVI
ncbi:NB-ARC domain-containing protein [Planktothrix agardhii 1029]|uniref:NB-ARC domain-containing protein n=1 Tax=Planktothrix agardhii TaxID=1160 RepID=UPI001D0B9A7C|nr:NB-ARC domain-containing protein [Planktothrix agardhii]MCB8765057.1 AAA family ATPase [Planktothrix agardhii 1809]MCB8778694.1 AAA family ATPase [Planktothrix agardhii 1031]MCB8783114.1 AAA family ATPase [Planktothrix agardhii 1808]MCF3565860.1 NB-ARC domain-containing protein [Planktothrix agardhii 1807]MCF3578305.1 NB-ARC domain-containing protein [Planktothrix agardhii 1812]